MANRKELEKQYKKLARQADKALRALEKSAQEGNKDFLKYAYSGAQRDIRHWGGRSRFGSKKENIPKNTRQLQAKIADIQSFLEKPTSTPEKIKEMYLDRIETIESSTSYDHPDFNLDSFQAYWDLGYGEKLKNEYGSKQAFNIVAAIQDNIDDIAKQIQQHRKREIFIDDDPLLNEQVNEVISSRKYGSKFIDVLML